MNLRQYQKDILNNLWKSLQTNDKVLLSAPTGSGKTVMASAFIDYVVKLGKRVAFVVDRIELVKQSRDTFGAENVSIIKAGFEADFDENKPIQIIMIQTFYARVEKLPDLNLDYIIIDEVHSGWGSGRIIELLKIYDNAKVIGLSATPIDERGYLLADFQDYIDLIQTKDLINLGYLAKPICYMPESCKLDLSKVKITGNDYDTEQLDNLLLDLEKVDLMIKEWENTAKNKKTIFFANSIDHAELITKELNNRGYKPLLLHSKQCAGELRENREQLQKADIIVNCAILTAGFDRKDLECVVLACPTKVLRKYIQCVGRGLRVTETKKECIIIDCGNCFNNHGLPDDYRFYSQKPKKEKQAQYRECPECGNIEPIHAKQCSICGYEFTVENDLKDNADKPKKDINRLIQIKSKQDELYEELKELVKERGHKRGFTWYLFKDLLKNSKTQGTGLIFYKKIFNRIKKCREKNYKLRWLCYQ